MIRTLLLFAAGCCALAPAMASAGYPFAIENLNDEPVTVLIRQTHGPSHGWQKIELPANTGATAVAASRYVDIEIRHYDSDDHAVEYDDFSWDFGGAVGYTAYGHMVYPLWMHRKAELERNADTGAWSVIDPNAAPADADPNEPRDIDYIAMMYGPVPETQTYWNVMYLYAELDIQPGKIVLRIGQDDEDEPEEIEPEPAAE